MDRSLIKKLLPDYVRDRLGKEETERVAAALLADSALAQECAKWREYFASIKALPHLTTPPGFALKVMQGISEQEKKTSLVNLIFKPFHIKLPLEAAVVLATVLVVIFLYRPFEKPGMHPETQIALAEKSVQPEMVEDKTAPASAPQPSSPIVRSESKQKRMSNRAAMPAQHANTGMAKPAAQLAMGEKAHYAKEMPALATREEPPASTIENNIGKKDQEMPPLARSMAPAAAAAAPAGAVTRHAKPLPDSYSVSSEKPIVVTMALTLADQEREELSKTVESRKFYKAKSAPLTDMKSGAIRPSENKIEHAIKTVVGSTLKIESETSEDGVIKYSFEIPDTCLLSLTTALKTCGILTFNKSKSQTKPGLARIILMVHKKGK